MSAPVRRITDTVSGGDGDSQSILSRRFYTQSASDDATISAVQEDARESR